MRLAATLVFIILLGAPAARAGEVPPQGGPESQKHDGPEWAQYAKTCKARVRANWHVPQTAKDGWPGAVTLHFVIARDGTVSGIEVVRRHCPRGFVTSARKTVLASSPFPAPPLGDSADETVGVTWTFLYNVTEELLREWDYPVPPDRIFD